MRRETMGSNKRKSKRGSKRNHNEISGIQMLEFIIIGLVFLGVIMGGQILYGMYGPIKEGITDLSEYEKRPYKYGMAVVARDLKLHLRDDDSYSIVDQITFDYYQDMDKKLEYQMPLYPYAYDDKHNLKPDTVKLTLIQDGVSRDGIYNTTIEKYGGYAHINKGKEGERITYKWEIEGGGSNSLADKESMIKLSLREGFDYYRTTDGTRNCDFQVEIRLDTPIIEDNIAIRKGIGFFDELPLELSYDGKTLRGRNKEFSYRKHYLSKGVDSREDNFYIYIYRWDLAPIEHDPRTTIKENKAFISTLHLSMWTFIGYIVSLAIAGFIGKRRIRSKENYHIIPLNPFPILVLGLSYMLIKEMQQYAYMLSDGEALYQAVIYANYNIMGIILFFTGVWLLGRDTKATQILGWGAIAFTTLILLITGFTILFETYKLEIWFYNALYFLFMSIYISFFIKVPKIYIPRAER